MRQQPKRLYVILGEPGPHQEFIEVEDEQGKGLKVGQGQTLDPRASCSELWRIGPFVDAEELAQWTPLERLAIEFACENFQDVLNFPPEFVVLAQMVQRDFNHEFEGDVGDGLGCTHCHQQPDHWIHRTLTPEIATLNPELEV